MEIILDFHGMTILSCQKNHGGSLFTVYIVYTTGFGNRIH